MIRKILTINSISATIGKKNIKRNSFIYELEDDGGVRTKPAAYGTIYEYDEVFHVEYDLMDKEITRDLILEGRLEGDDLCFLGHISKANYNAGKPIIVHLTFDPQVTTKIVKKDIVWIIREDDYTEMLPISVYFNSEKEKNKSEK